MLLGLVSEQIVVLPSSHTRLRHLLHRHRIGMCIVSKHNRLHLKVRTILSLVLGHLVILEYNIVRIHKFLSCFWF